MFVRVGGVVALGEFVTRSKPKVEQEKAVWMSRAVQGLSWRRGAWAAGAFALVFTACALMSSHAEAQQRGGRRGSIKDTSRHDRPMMLSFFTGFHYRGGIRRGDFPLIFAGRFYIPIMHDGFLRPINDEFGVEFGADMNVYTGGGRFGLGFPVTAMWDFHFSEMFDAYGKVGFILGNDFVDTRNGTRNDFWYGPVGAAGIRLRITDWLYFRAEGGYPVVMAGLGFAF